MNEDPQCTVAGVITRWRYEMHGGPPEAASIFYADFPETAVDDTKRLMRSRRRMAGARMHGNSVVMTYVRRAALPSAAGAADTAVTRPANGGRTGAGGRCAAGANRGRTW